MKHKLMLLLAMSSLTFQAQVFSERIESGADNSHQPFVFHRNFDAESESYAAFFRMNSKGTYTGIAGRYAQYLPERTLSLEEIDTKGTLVSSKVIARRPAGNGIGDFSCATADIAPDGSLYVLLNNYTPGKEWNSVMKLNASGDSVWEVMVSEKWQWSAIVMRKLISHPFGGFVVAGSTNNFPTKARVSRYSDAGNLLWSNDGFKGDYGYNKFDAVTVNEEGKVFVGGIVHHNLNSRQSALVAKVDTAGAIEWQKVLYSGYLTSGDSLMGEITTLLPTADGGCIAGGFESAKGKWGGWAMLHKFSEAGEIQWTKRYFYTGDDFQDAKVIGLSALPSSNNFMVYAHRDWGNTSAGATLMECTEQGDSLWSQVDYDYRFQFSGVDPTGNVLMIAGAPYAPTNWNSQRFYLRATPDGLFRTPELIYPFANYSDISYKPRFEWVKTGHLQTKTHLQVAHDSLFTNLIAENKAIDGTTFEQLVLPSNTVCYFRVREVGIKGFPGSWSEVRKFTTEVRTVTDATNYKPITATYDKSLQQLRIISSDELLLSKATLFDSTGRLCGCFSFDTTNPAVISIKEFRQGVYILKLTMSDFKETTLKVIIN